MSFNLGTAALDNLTRPAVEKLGNLELGDRNWMKLDETCFPVSSL